MNSIASPNSILGSKVNLPITFCVWYTAVAAKLLLVLEDDGVDDAEEGDDEDDDIDGERGHGLVAELHVLAAEAVNRVGHGLVVLEVLLVGILEPGPELLQPAALGLLRQGPVVEPPGLLLAQQVVNLPEADELLRRRLQWQRRCVRVVLLGQPPVRSLYLLEVRLRIYPQKPAQFTASVVSSITYSNATALW
jgi:hypothetical protein